MPETDKPMQMVLLVISDTHSIFTIRTTSQPLGLLKNRTKQSKQAPDLSPEGWLCKATDRPCPCWLVKKHSGKPLGCTHCHLCACSPASLLQWQTQGIHSYVYEVRTRIFLSTLLRGKLEGSQTVFPKSGMNSRTGSTTPLRNTAKANQPQKYSILEKKPTTQEYALSESLSASFKWSSLVSVGRSPGTGSGERKEPWSDDLFLDGSVLRENRRMSLWILHLSARVFTFITNTENYFFSKMISNIKLALWINF